jgi:hypothetical protein
VNAAFTFGECGLKKKVEIINNLDNNQLLGHMALFVALFNYFTRPYHTSRYDDVL